MYTVYIMHTIMYTCTHIVYTRVHILCTLCICTLCAFCAFLVPFYASCSSVCSSI